MFPVSFKIDKICSNARLQPRLQCSGHVYWGLQNSSPLLAPWRRVSLWTGRNGNAGLYAPINTTGPVISRGGDPTDGAALLTLDPSLCPTRCQHLYELYYLWLNSPVRVAQTNTYVASVSVYWYWRAVRWLFTDVSEERNASILRIEK
jgi:hypothetical protein